MDRWTDASASPRRQSVISSHMETTANSDSGLENTEQLIQQTWRWCQKHEATLLLLLLLLQQAQIAKMGNLSLCFYIDTLNRNSSQSTRNDQTRWARSSRPCSPGLVCSSRLWTVYERKTTDVHVWTSLHVRRRRGWSKRIHHTVLTFIKVTLRLWRQESNLFNKADMFGETSARLTRTLAMFLKCFKPNHDIFRTLNKWFLCHKQCIQN